LLDPGVESRQDIVLGVRARGTAGIAEIIQADAASATSAVNRAVRDRLISLRQTPVPAGSMPA
jgi:hypothetical protein